MEEICRICMSNTKDLILLVENETEKNTEIAKTGLMFEECFGIKINELPNYNKICMPCKIQLTYFYDFKLQAIRTHLSQLQLVLSDHESSDEIIENCESIEFSMKDEIGDGDSFIIEYLEDDDLDILDDLESLDQDTIKTDELETFEEKNEIYSNLEEEEEEEEEDNEKEFLKYIESDNEIHFKIEYQTDSDSTTVKNKTVLSKMKYHCEPCGKKFRNEITFNAHMNIHDGLSPYRCKICNKGFKYKANFEYHMKNHNNTRSFKCTLCDKSFLCNWDLKIHSRVHGNIRPYICEICGKQFRVRSHMTDHRETHNSENTYQCLICLQKYKTRATLKMHVSTIHARVKQFFCHICGKSFNRKHHLKVHHKVHEKTPKKAS